MSQLVTINITTGTEALATITGMFIKPTSDQREEARAISNYFIAAESGLRTCSFDVQVNGSSNGNNSVAATGTVAFSGISTANDTLVVNGVTLTAVASGAGNNQWNVKTTSALQATEVARAINAATGSAVSGTVVASVSSSTVTLSALVKGVIGNSITFAKGTDAGSVMTVTVSNGRLEGGVNTTPNVYHFGQ